MADGHWGVGGVVLQQGGLHLFDMSRTQIDAKAGAQGCQSIELFPFRYARASSGTTENDGLHHAWKGEFAGEAGGCGLVGTDPRHHLHRDAGVT